jgi:hypothetical protein
VASDQRWSLAHPVTPVAPRSQCFLVTESTTHRPIWQPEMLAGVGIEIRQGPVEHVQIEQRRSRLHPMRGGGGSGKVGDPHLASGNVLPAQGLRTDRGPRCGDEGDTEEGGMNASLNPRSVHPANPVARPFFSRRWEALGA